MLRASVAPHLREPRHPFYQTGGVLLCLLPLTGFSCMYYGIRPLLLVLFGLLGAMFTELLCCMAAHRRPTLSDGTAAVTGALIGAMMSPLTPLWVPVIGAMFAIGVTKMPFGGIGRNIFNPAAAGMAFCAICFATRLFEYPDPSQSEGLPLWDTTGVITAVSPMQQLAGGGVPKLDLVTLLSGDFPGPIGSAGILILVASALFLFVRRSSSPYILVSYLVTCAVIAALFPRMDIGIGMSVQLELCTGLLLFCGVFLLSDPVTAPRFWLARIVYGVMAGILVMVLRHYGRFVCSEFFAVLLVNSFSAVLDRTCWSLLRRFRHWKEVVRV
ncbi:MAG: RnfABCDGE type electron transport complex subunit D [Clostridia bacterium]|nr:RnfABCDGE type electron transport complex subunit D [Clostridia bacterium]